MKFWTAFNSVILIHDLWWQLLIADCRHCRRHSPSFRRFWFFFIVAEKMENEPNRLAVSLWSFFASVQYFIGFVSNHDQYACHSFKQFETWESIAYERGTMQENRVKRRRRGRRQMKRFGCEQKVSMAWERYVHWNWSLIFGLDLVHIMHLVYRIAYIVLVARIQTQLSKIQNTRTNGCFLFFFE